MSVDPSNMPLAEGKRLFATTQWSVVLAAGNIDRHEARIALAQLCEAYWFRSTRMFVVALTTSMRRKLAMVMILKLAKSCSKSES
jgi:hypothetical protein